MVDKWQIINNIQYNFFLLATWALLAWVAVSFFDCAA